MKNGTVVTYDTLEQAQKAQKEFLDETIAVTSLCKRKVHGVSLIVDTENGTCSNTSSF